MKLPKVSSDTSSGEMTYVVVAAIIVYFENEILHSFYFLI